MENIHMYVVLGAPPRSDVAIVHHQEMTPGEHDKLRAEYDTGALDDAVMVARGWLYRVLDTHESDEPPQDGDDVPSRDEGMALGVLFGCLAEQANEAAHAGNRWTVIDVRYHRDHARVKVMWWMSQPEFIVVSEQVGHA